MRANARKLGLVLTTLMLVALLLSTFGAALVTAQAAWYVDDDTCPAVGDGSAGNPFCKIQDAINAASAGDTINVAAGTYDEYIGIQKPVNLLGAGSSVTTITSSGTENIVFIGDNSVPTFAEGMTLEGFTLISTGLTDDKEYINLRASGPTSTDRIVIRNNVFNCVNQENNVVGIETVSGGDTAHFLIDSNDFVNECRYAMWFNSAVNAEIRGNTISDAKYTALALCTSDIDQIHDVDIVDNNIVRSTSFSDAASYPGWAIWFSGMHIGSTVYNMNISGNTITDGNYHSIVIHDRGTTDLSNVHINCNNMDSNPDGFVNEVAVAVDAEYNWWGDAGGPSGEGTGTGDPVSANVLFDPWMTTPVDGVCPPPAVIEVEIDVKPRRFPNIIELELDDDDDDDDECDDDSRLKVAILTTPDFDARTVDPSTVALGDPALGGTATPFRSRARDVDRDGDRDLLLFFSLCELVGNDALDGDSTELVLTGQTFDGVDVIGSDSVLVVLDDDDDGDDDD